MLLHRSDPFSCRQDKKDTALSLIHIFNIARLHLIDSGIEDGIWGRKSSGGRVIRKEAMNKLCYLISELKKRGIYIMLDLMTSMPPNADLECADLENQVNGLKKFGYFDDTIKQIQKEYANLLLS